MYHKGYYVPEVDIPNIEREDYFAKIKKDYFTDKGKKKEICILKEFSFLGKFAASAQHRVIS